MVSSRGRHALRLPAQLSSQHRPEPWPSESEVEAGFEKQELPTGADGLNDLAWSLVDPDARVFGREFEAVMLAGRAVESADASNRAIYQDTLAWALLWAGRIDEALQESCRAVSEASAEDRADFEGYVRRMEATARPFRDGSAVGRHEALRSEISALEEEVPARRTWTYTKSEDTWWERELVTLVAGLDVDAGQFPRDSAADRRQVSG